ncbi:hypothetical protein NEF87_003523 [Candidatus Lokiarchaeum ossiferum]|uniref:Lysoplasmalogenase n=1 Tax=Candidatus Lokiarchaeum ossiferum TaxID=2951803 RepID=A0ABY6HV77_9ARCH|nr:hypothetical protein NEF87_003523 [Candidatus Lokiarchaeum sp. B-35]
MALSIIPMIIFFVFVGAHLFGEYLIIKENKDGMKIRYITKPFLIPLLGLFYITGNSAINWWLVAGLVGGFGGDVCLMIPDPNNTKKFFRIGLISFLLGHVFYIIAFIVAADGFQNYKFWSFLLTLPYMIIGALVFPRLTKHTGKMTKAVTIYLVVIVLMGVSTSFLWGIGDPGGIILAMIGALIFMISDTINAFNKFASPIPYERLYTMSTYLIGQFLIILGFLLALHI